MTAADAPRVRVIIDNDFSGDPDDLFQLAHHVLSPSVRIPFVIGSHLAPGDFFDPSEHQAENAAGIARDLLHRMGAAHIPVVTGSNVAMSDPLTPVRSQAVDAIIAEALREDPLPLYLAMGAGLTEIASALLVEPAIADRLTIVWIGGPEHEGLAVPPPGVGAIEYNLAIDIPSAQTVFNHSRVPLWQVPRDAYRQALVSSAELETRVRPRGCLGALLADSIETLRQRAGEHGVSLGETYVLGDSPLVLLTALQSSFEPDPSSSAYVTMPAPRMSSTGAYEADATGRPIRVYTRLDVRLMFEDFYAKLALAES